MLQDESVAQDTGSHNLELQQRVIDSLNAIFGPDLSKLDQVDQVRQSLAQKVDQLDSRLDLANTLAPNKLQTVLQSSRNIKGQLERLAEQQDRLMVSSGEVGEEVRQFSSENRELLADISCVRGVTQYTVWVQLVQDLDTELGAAVDRMDGFVGREVAVKTYNGLREVQKELKESQCSHLRKYVTDTVSHWFNLLQERLVLQLEEGLKSLGWPFIQLDESNRTLDDTSACCSILELQSLVRSLIQIQEMKDDSEDQGVLTLAMKVLLKPLRKRFKFHFMGSKSTNNPGKPEWYTTQLVLWASLHRTFLDTHIQPVYDELGILVPARMEFSTGLVGLATDKLSKDLPLVHADDVLLAHTIDEAIGFAREMVNQLQYSTAQPSALRPLTDNPSIFSRWINMERKFAFEKLDLVVVTEGAWETEVGSEGLVPRAAESFLAVLLAVTERYKFLAATQHRLQFLELQLQLLEDFRLRLVQLMRSEGEEPLQSTFCPILVTVDHLATVLASWGETPFFLQLEFQRGLQGEKEEGEQEQTDMAGTVFDETISKLEYLRNEMIGTIVSNILYSVKAKSRSYRKEVKWFSLAETEVLEVQPGACSMLQALVFQLGRAKTVLPTHVFSRVWQTVANLLGTFLCEELVLQNRFNQAGACQLETDVRRGLLPIFGEFTSRPSSHFPLLMDCLKLLTSRPGVLLLTMEALQGSDEGANNTLRDLGVSRLTAEQAISVINTRVDLDIL